MRSRTTLAPMLLFLVLAGRTPVQAQLKPTPQPLPSGFSISADAVYMEEEWELLVTDPDPANDGPQVETYMSLVQDTSEPYLWFMLNVREEPGPFVAGGMQIQLWDYSERLLSYSTYGSSKFQTSNEVITWRQRMVRPDKAGGVGSFQICNGTSQTWGYFGISYTGLSGLYYPGPARVAFTPNICKDFSQYNPAISVQMSRVTWEPNHVGHLRLLNVRQYDSLGNVLSTWAANRDVDLTK